MYDEQTVIGTAIDKCLISGASEVLSPDPVQLTINMSNDNKGINYLDLKLQVST